MSQRVLHTGARPIRASRSVTPAFGAMTIAGTSGIVAGMMMAMFAMIVAAIAGYGFWAPPRAITALFFGTDHLAGGFDFGDVVGGVAIHMALSMTFGIGFAVILAPLKKVNTMAQIMVGMGLGVVLWEVNTYLVAPIFEGNVFADAMPTWAWIAAHLGFGGVLGMIYALWRRGETALAPAA